MNDVAARVHRVIAAAFGVPPASITSATGQESIDGWDSLTHIHLIAALEAEFGISIDPDLAIEMTTVGAICTAITGLVG